MPLRAPGPDSNSAESSLSHSSKDAENIANEAADKISQAGESRREEGRDSAEKLSKEEADAKYEEAIEEEYAKREGGA